MALFQVPGWTVPSAPVQEAPKARKRKRPADTTGGGAEEKIQSAQINVEKLLEKFNKDIQGGGGDAPAQKKRKRKAANTKEASSEAQAQAQGEGERKQRHKQREPQGDRELTRGAKRSRMKQKRAEELKAKQDAVAVAPEGAGPGKKNKKAKACEAARDAPPSVLAPESTVETPGSSKEGLTALQAGMKSSLDGARFRWINEQLYKSDSAKALELMRQNPRIFSEYHTGFRHQVASWPSNPVAHYIAQLSAYAPKTVIADLGAGDAALARALVPRGMTVLSYDLVADGSYVVEADTCGRLPLPGSESGGGGGGDDEDEDEGEGEGEDQGVKGEGAGAVVDVVVCALSLMGTNWPGTIREAWRILRPGGELLIAEVASRFTDADEFAGFVSSFGFRLKKKDDANTHFTLFEFKKVARLPKSDKEWSKMLSRGNLLKPCEYKRR